MKSKNLETRDYAMSGMSIWKAMLDHGRKRPKAERGPLRIRWGDRVVQTADVFEAPRNGTIWLECIRAVGAVRQGFDVKMNGGCVLGTGEVVPILRTWCDAEYEPVVEYEYRADDGLISTWNVYEVDRGTEVVPEKWTGNAGFWIEAVTPFDRIYHCSGGSCSTPDFESLVYRVTVTGAVV